MNQFLVVEGLSKDFGGIQAVSELSLELAGDELLCVIGPNGCGKTTVFNLLTGHFPPSAGRIRLDGHEITGLKPFEIARLGVGRKFQVPGVYPELTVRENLEVPLFAGAGRHGLRGLLATKSGSGDVVRLLELARLADKADWLAGTLSHGEKQWLEIAMLLAGKPRLMLLDEPTAGMTIAETEATADLILRVHRETGVAIVAIEHDLGFVRQLNCPIAVMMKGQILTRGSYEEVRANPLAREVYLGRKA